jgi:hypothetical protein
MVDGGTLSLENLTASVYERVRRLKEKMYCKKECFAVLG